MLKHEKRLPAGIIGYTSDGVPIVTPTHRCEFFTGEEDSLCLLRECWYCKHADFRKNTCVTLKQSTCHCNTNKINLQKG